MLILVRSSYYLHIQRALWVEKRVHFALIKCGSIWFGSDWRIFFWQNISRWISNLFWFHTHIITTWNWRNLNDTKELKKRMIKMGIVHLYLFLFITCFKFGNGGFIKLQRKVVNQNIRAMRFHKAAMGIVIDWLSSKVTYKYPKNFVLVVFSGPLRFDFKDFFS